MAMKKAVSKLSFYIDIFWAIVSAWEETEENDEEIKLSG
jgi:hypothetical protein